LDERERELETLGGICREMGELLLSERGRLRTVDYKSATDLVTDIDRTVEARLADRLGADFPDDAILAEEGTRTDGGSGRVWHVDPLDGTTNYVHGHPVFAVSLGAVRDGVPELGAVYLPVLDELYLAAAGRGARLERSDGPPLRLAVSPDVPLQRALLATGFPYRRDELVDVNCALMAGFLRSGCRGVRRCGSAAADLCFVAAGRIDGYWEFRLNSWDLAAGSLIAAEAGARVTDLSGRGGLLDGASIVAAGPGLHPVLMERIHAGLPAGQTLVDV